MCGIVGILRNGSIDILQGTVRKMTADVSHRGPDDEGIVFLCVSSRGDLQPCCETDDKWKVALGSRRLAILDLSFSGHMPMAYHDRFWIVYNGEIYNFVEIRLELEQLGHIFRSSSDTEVILAAYEQWGSASFTLFRGMWGFIIFDCLKKEAILCRDRLGIKPLYLWRRQGMLAVASEIKQFLSLPGFTAHIDPITTTEYFQTGYENPNRSFLRDIQIVPAGSWLKIPLDTLIPSVPEEYWHPERVQISITDVEEAGGLFANELRESVRLHLRSEVPVGCALSGGLDSSAIAVLISELQGGQNHQLQTFTSTFPGDKVDEREYADALATRIGGAPHYVTPNPITFLEEMDSFLRTHDEPVGSISMYAGYCIARLTRQAGVPVTLNGQGGDEILSGIGSLNSSIFVSL
jgi:asparagine synthase (glutamine-hydrolysing)